MKLNRSLKINTTISILLFALIITLIFTSVLPLKNVSAQGDEINLIEPLPGANTLTRGSNLLPEYLSLIFRYSISIAAILALLFIVLGGVRYVFTSVSPSEKSAAKTMIFNAIWGLLIVLLSYLILFTINPDFVKNSLNLPFITLDVARDSVSVSGGSTYDATTLPGYRPYGTSGPVIIYDPGVYDPATGLPIGALPNATEDQQNRIEFATTCYEQGTGVECYGYTGNTCQCINVKNNICTSEGQTNCTSVGGLQPTTKNGVKELFQECQAYTRSGARQPCVLIITGGTEAGHTCCAHRDGYKLDFRPNSSLDRYIINNTRKVGTTRIDGKRVNIREGTLPSGIKIRVIDERRTSSPHWDVEFISP